MYLSILWLVYHSMVKLSKLCNTGEEVLVGLAVEGMVVSSILTGLKTYQASALSYIELASISLAEIAASPTPLCLLRKLLHPSQ